MSCEKCWSDAYMRMWGEPSKSQAEHYEDLIVERQDEKACSIPEQHGPQCECPLCPNQSLEDL